MDGTEQCSPLSSSETPEQQTDLTTVAAHSIPWKTPWKSAYVTLLADESKTSLIPSEMPWKEGDVTQLVDQSLSPSLYPSNTPYRVDHVSSLAGQSSSQFPSETPWKLADVIPSLNQPEAVLPQRYRFSLIIISFRPFRGIVCLLFAVSDPLEGWDESKKKKTIERNLKGLCHPRRTLKHFEIVGLKHSRRVLLAVFICLNHVHLRIIPSTFYLQSSFSNYRNCLFRYF